MAMKISAGPEPLDFEVYAGDRNKTLLVIPSEEPLDLTGALIEAQARKTAPDPVIAISAVITPADPVNATLWIEWPGDQLRTLLSGAERATLVWDLQITEAGETLPRTVFRGAFTVVHDVTRA